MRGVPSLAPTHPDIRTDHPKVFLLTGHQVRESVWARVGLRSEQARCIPFAIARCIAASLPLSLCPSDRRISVFFAEKPLWR